MNISLLWQDPVKIEIRINCKAKKLHTKPCYFIGETLLRLKTLRWCRHQQQKKTIKIAAVLKSYECTKVRNM
jgi:hypothetical protein